MGSNKIKTVGHLRKIIENLSDDYEIDIRIRRKLSDNEIKELKYILIHTRLNIQNLSLMI